MLPNMLEYTCFLDTRYDDSSYINAKTLTLIPPQATLAMSISQNPYNSVELAIALHRPIHRLY